MAVNAAWFAALPILALGASPRPTVEEPKARGAPTLAERIDAELREQSQAGFSGAVLVAERGVVVLDQAYGRVGDVPMRPTSRFWIASVAKQFTSAAILRCQERGLLRLQDPLARFFPDAPAEKRAITILQLLTHQSGLPQQYVAQGVSDRSVAVSRILAQPLESPPGTRFSYSNDNYGLAAAALEIVTGQSYESFVKDELLGPAGLRDTGFAGTDSAGSVVPARNPQPARLGGRDWGTVGSGAVFSTTRDLLAWLLALRDGRVLRPDSVSLLFDPYVAIGEGASGLGWFVRTPSDGVRCVFTRGNDDFGPNSLVYIYPDLHRDVVILSHAGQRDDGLSFSRAALLAVEKHVVGEPAERVEAAEATEIQEVQRPCIEMLEAWYGGDGDKMARVLHDDLAKRGVLTSSSGEVEVHFAGKRDMVEGARRGVGRIPKPEWDIHAEILDRRQSMATVRVVSAYLIDVCQVAKLGGRWLVVNVLWTTRRTPPWF